MRYWKKPKVEGTPVVAVVISTYNQNHSLRCLLASLSAQTYSHWCALVIHDGPPTPASLEARVGAGENIFFSNSPARRNVFGHDLRDGGRLEALRMNVDALVFTNGDNYYAPTFLHDLVAPISRGEADLSYCDAVHSHKLWKPLPAKLKRGHVDIGSLMFASSLIKDVRWDRTDFAADWFYLEKVLTKKPRTRHVGACLFVHN